MTAAEHLGAVLRPSCSWKPASDTALSLEILLLRPSQIQEKERVTWVGMTSNMVATPAKAAGAPS